MSGFAQPKFVKSAAKKLSALNQVPPAALFNVHEEPTQSIQGGSANQHWHLNTAQHTFLTSLAAASRYEPVMDSSGVILTNSTGDILMELVA